MDETNREEALRCLKIAKNQFGSKNYDAAVRLTKKSLALYTTEEAQEFLKRAEEKAASNENTGSSTSVPQQPSIPTQEKREKPSASQQSSDVREVLACGTDYYKVLKVDKKCTEVEVKKSYRKVISS
jgi:DnaJ family protein B protein 12